MANPKSWKVKLTGTLVQYIDRLDEKNVQTFDTQDLPQNIRDKLAPKGLSVLLQERTSDIPKDQTQLVMDARESVFTMLKAGHWEKDADRSGPTVSAEIEAIANIKGISVAEAQKAMRELRKTDPKLAEKVLGSKKVKDEAARIRKSRETTSVDLSDLL